MTQSYTDLLEAVAAVEIYKTFETRTPFAAEKNVIVLPKIDAESKIGNVKIVNQLRIFSIFTVETIFKTNPSG